MRGNSGILTSRNTVFLEAIDGATPELLGILAKAREFLQSDVAESTREVYSRDWRAFIRWCGEYGVDGLPTAPDVIICYLTTLAMRGLRVSTIRRHAAAISSVHRAAGYPSPTSHPAVRELLSGMTRKLGAPPKPVDALMSADIKNLVASLPDTTIGARDKALILLGFAGAFRRSELVALNVDDIRRGDEGIVVLLRRSKTDQRGEGRWVGIPHGKTQSTCPVRALYEWLEASGIRDGAIFRGLDRRGRIISERLSSRSVGDIIKRAAKRAGLDPTRYSGHSLRSGHCTQAARAGVPEHVIMKQTGHRSQTTLRRYVRLGKIFEENSARDVGL